MNVTVVPQSLDRFTEVWMMDFEFIARPGEHPVPVCLVALEMRSGLEVRRWSDQMTDPLPISSDSVVVAYYAPAELGCYLAMGWPMPANVLDLFAEFRIFCNGRERQLGILAQSLLGALAHFGLSHLDPGVKTHWRDRIIAGGPYSDDDRQGILDYCATDVEALCHLLPKLVERLERRPYWLEHALLRGRYMRAVACMEHAGTPLDMSMLAKLISGWSAIKAGLIAEIQARYPIFDGTTLRSALFEGWLMNEGIPWPRTESGRLSMSDDTFKAMAKSYPIVAPLGELRANLSKLRLTELAAGTDGRNRTMLSPFRARTGRNAPSASKFIFAPSVWLRSLVMPRPGSVLVYIDYSSQEIGIAAALSGDEAMIRAYQSGDPYMAFAKDANLVPPEATKATHKAMRDRCKAIVLGTLYGMQAESLAESLGIPVCEARSLLRAHRRTYSTFWAWSQRVMDSAMLTGFIDTCFGWRLHVTADTRPTSLLNHPMQAHGAEILRLACSLVTEAGVTVCAPVHDALLIEVPEDRVDEVVDLTRALMGEASKVVLAGFEIRTDFEVIRYPDRYCDPRGEGMWSTVTGIVARLESAGRGHDSGTQILDAPIASV